MDPGQIIDRYEVEQRIGSGGMATVYRVRHTTLGSLHALKVLMLTGPAIRERLVREGQLQAQLDHPHIVSVTDVIEVEGGQGLVMELVDGPDLEGWLTHHRPDLDQALALFEGILAAVEAAHAGGVVHRDLKPANVLLKRVGDTWVPKVADFGLAKACAGDTGLDRTRSGVAMGTPAYMAPEQFRDAKRADERADLFALGCILYELATGCRAFDGPDMMAIFSQSSSGSYVPPRELAVDLPEPIAAAIEGCLRPSPENRLQDCAGLRAVLRGTALPPRASRTLDPFQLDLDAPEPTAEAPPPRRSPVILAGVLLAIGASAGLVRWLAPDGPPPAPVAVPQHLRIGVNEPVKPLFDVHSLVLDGNRQVIDVVVEALVHRTPGGDLAPLTLASWTPGPDGLTLELRLRENLFFHRDPCAQGGPPVLATAEDLAWSIRNGLGTSELLRLVDGPDAIVVLDDHAVRLQLAAPAPYADLALQAVALLPARVDECADLSAWARPVGTGPFQLVEVTDRGVARLERHPAYWGRDSAGAPLPRLARLSLVPVLGADDALARVSAGDLHLHPVPFGATGGLLDPAGELVDPSLPVLLRRPQADEIWELRVMVAPADGPLSDPALRRLLAATLDREALAQGSEHVARLRTRFLEGGMLGFDPMLDAAALIPEGPGPADTPSLVLGTSANRRAVAERAAAQWAAAGLEVRVVTLGGQDLSRAIRGESVDLLLVGTQETTRGDERVGLAVGRDPARSEAVHALREELVVEPDRARRAALYRDLEIALIRDAMVLPVGPMATDWGVFLVHPSLRGGFDEATGRRTLRHGAWEAWLSLAEP